MVLPARYYGSVDATPLFVVLLHEAWKWGLPEKELKLLLPHARAAMKWVEGAMGGDHLIRYGKGRANGLLHQGWKDSPDAVRDAEGRHIEPPIALCEVQGYAYQAAMAYSDILTALGDGAVRPSGGRSAPADCAPPSTGPSGSPSPRAGAIRPSPSTPKGTPSAD
ncbi:hypothetical protein SAV31267_082380 [Streptomyces avermitilis]|uniref:Glycogen debranching enzyme C-terminal domain-containing protein n=1 Tax=Streptomyces avermitilis TaxID=33903 RepID=A0A4D4N310_STRAX|nr:hypothetical protein SAV31267_082380 [Streptomyces avermitilis]